MIDVALYLSGFEICRATGEKPACPESPLPQGAFHGQSKLVQLVFEAIESPHAAREPPLTDKNTDFWAGMRMNDNALDEEKAGFDIISIIPNLCKPGTGVQRNLDAWAKGALKPIHVLFKFRKFL
jgi:hypothetical protein